MSAKSFMLRGTLGGLLGALVKALLFWIFYVFKPEADGGYKYLVIMLPIFGLPWAALAGALIGYVIVNISDHKRPGLWTSSAVGAGALAAIGAAGYLLGARSVSIDNVVGVSIFSLFFPDFGVISGALAGLLCGHSSRHKSDLK